MTFLTLLLTAVLGLLPAAPASTSSGGPMLVPASTSSGGPMMAAPDSTSSGGPM